MVISAPDGLGFLASAGPALVWLIVLSFVFIECAVILGLFLPGDSMLITAGIVLANHSSGTGHVWALSAGAMTAAICGNQVGYAIGHRTGNHILARRGGKYLNYTNLHRVNMLLERRGFWAVLIARWIPWVRTLCPLVAGAAKMNHAKYTVASSIGAILWAPVLLLIGFYGGSLLDRVPWLMPAVLTFMVVLLLIGTTVGVWHYRQEMARPPEEVAVEEVRD
ncbi:DedA family protein [Rhodococcus marinonascens]|uniref:DedA family protein n=1 Tax=Rhodococcus marinonascens TaxID=38311 RepID=UPI0009355729|nr:DedA family protein [Rhodococcus marinonascens]